MNKAIKAIIWTIAALVLALPAQAFAQETTGAKDAKSSPAPRAVLPFKSFQFGKVYRGELISQIFIIRNEGDADLMIKGTRSS